MKKLLYTIIFLFLTGAVYAQSADVVTDILNTSEVTYGQICYLSAVNQGLVSDSATYSEAVSILYENDQLPDEVSPDAPIKLADLTYVYSRIWNIKGGLLYTLTKGSPRYAFKQFKADEILEDEDPDDFVSGPAALNILTSCLFKYGGMTLDEIDEE